MTTQTEAPKHPMELLQGMFDMMKQQAADQERQRVGDGLWTLTQVATYLSLSESTVRKCLMKKSGFPAIRKLPTTADGGSNRWIAEEIKQWAKRQ